MDRPDLARPATVSQLLSVTISYSTHLHTGEVVARQVEDGDGVVLLQRHVHRVAIRRQGQVLRLEIARQRRHFAEYHILMSLNHSPLNITY